MTAFHRNWIAEAIYGERPLCQQERKLTKCLAAWINKAFVESGRPVFMLSLTCKQAKPNASGGLIWLNTELLREALEVYFRRIDWKVYKNASRRGKKAVERFCVVEGGNFTGKRMHVHMLVVAPPGRYMKPMDFVSLLIQTWRSSLWGMENVHWDFAHHPEGAAKYLLKTGLDAVDWHNTRV